MKFVEQTLDLYELYQKEFASTLVEIKFSPKMSTPRNTSEEVSVERNKFLVPGLSSTVGEVSKVCKE